MILNVFIQYTVKLFKVKPPFGPRSSQPKRILKYPCKRLRGRHGALVSTSGFAIGGCVVRS